MAVLGFHLLVSVLAGLLLSKCLHIMPLTNWLLSNLLLWMVPPNDYLVEYIQQQRAASSNSGGKSRPSRKNAAEKRQAATAATASTTEKDVDIPKDVALPLFPVKLKPTDLTMLLFFDDLHWIIHLAGIVCVHFVASEIFQVAFPEAYQTDANTTPLWVILLLYYTVKMIFELTWLVVAENRDSAERTLVGLATLCFFVLAVSLLVLDGKWIDMGVDKGVKLLVTNEAMPVVRQKSNMRVVECVMALSAAFLATTLVFPALRLARSYTAALKRGTLLDKVVAQLSFISPLCLAMLWVPSLTSDLLCPKEAPLIPGFTLSHYQHLRLLLVLVFCVLRVATAQRHLQLYLHCVHDKLEVQRPLITRFTSSKMNNIVRTVNGGVAVVALQYLCPVIILLCSIAMVHSCGDYTWTGGFLASVPMASLDTESLRSMTRIGVFIHSVLPPQFLASLFTFYTVYLLVAMSVSSWLGFVYVKFSETTKSAA